MKRPAMKGNKNALGTVRVKGKDAPNYKGGWVAKNGYRYVNVYTYGKHRQLGEHRHVMEQHLGRELASHEHIDHINGNKLDNRIENLRITDIKGNCRFYWGITEQDEKTVISRLKEGKTYRECLEGTAIKSIATVWRIRKNNGLA